MWRADLTPLDAVMAGQALQDLRDAETYRPTWAAFREVYGAKVRQAHMRSAGESGLPEPQAEQGTPVTERLANVHAARIDQHDHRNGHLRCPVCSLHDHDAHGEHTSDCQRCKTIGRALMAG